VDRRAVVQATRLVVCAIPAVPRWGAGGQGLPGRADLRLPPDARHRGVVDLCEPDQQDLEVISEEFGLHPLAVEDAVQQHERPKLDRYQGPAPVCVDQPAVCWPTGCLATAAVATREGSNPAVAVRNRAICPGLGS
jgi:hypothetical protein